MKIWKIVQTDPAHARNLAEGLGLPVPIASVLLGRGLDSPSAIERFLNPRLSRLSDPFCLPGMSAAVDRIVSAIRAGERIAVYGDYDVDGVTSAGLMVRVLSRMGARVSAFIPSRTEEGYGLTVEGVERCARTCSPSLIVTVDCGTCAQQAIDRARDLGIDTVVTDHHEPSVSPAQAAAVVNPKLGEDASSRMLAGVGVAFKTCHALVKHGRDEGLAGCEGMDLRQYLDWVAVGTVADAVPLTEENRILVTHGLARLNRDPSPGLRALVEVAGLSSRIESFHLGFVLGPRINAAGRVGDAQAALDLLLADRKDRADELASALDAANAERKRIESRILEEAEARIAREFDPEGDHLLFLAGREWNIGVLGIVASRLCARYRRPVVTLALDDDGMARGSCRSVEEFDILAALRDCSDLLLRFGGHRMAAGLHLEAGNLMAFRERLGRIAAERLRCQDLRPVVRVDARLNLGEADAELLKAIERLGPFGEGNPEPIWMAQGVQVVGEPRLVGKEHLKLTCASGGRQIEAIGFGLGSRTVPRGPIDVAFSLEDNTWLGRRSVQLNLKDFRPSRS